MTGSLSPNLILSLIFGVGQVVVGGWLAAYPLIRGQFTRWRQGLMMFVGLWFVVSGVVELAVSGMETSRRLTGGPDAIMFALWRGRADTALVVASALLACGALVYPLALRWLASGAPDATVDVEGEGKPRE